MKLIRQIQNPPERNFISFVHYLNIKVILYLPPPSSRDINRDRDRERERDTRDFTPWWRGEWTNISKYKCEDVNEQSWRKKGIKNKKKKNNYTKRSNLISILSEFSGRQGSFLCRHGYCDATTSRIFAFFSSCFPFPPPFLSFSLSLSLLLPSLFFSLFHAEPGLLRAGQIEFNSG